MIYKVDINKSKGVINNVYKLFSSMTDTLILSCLQGHMGEVWVDDEVEPKAAQLKVRDFVFYAGDEGSKEAKNLINNISESCLVIVNTDKWKSLIEDGYKEKCNKFSRYSFFKDFDRLNYNYVKSLISKLPEEYEVRQVDEEILEMESSHELSEDFIRQFESKEDFLRRGCGYCIMHKGQVVCGATSYTIYDNGIEIEIDTHIDHRRKGLATVAAASLIIHCLDKGIYPSWDAANLASVALAKKLGYVMDQEYDTYFIEI